MYSLLGFDCSVLLEGFFLPMDLTFSKSMLEKLLSVVFFSGSEDPSGGIRIF